MNGKPLPQSVEVSASVIVRSKVVHGPGSVVNREGIHLTAASLSDMQMELLG